MKSTKFSILAFHFLRLSRTHPVVVLVMALASALALLSGAEFVAQAQLARMASAELDGLVSAAKSALAAPSLVPVAIGVPKLPSFSSAELVDTVNQIATDINLPVDEISYTLEEGGAQPYLRYRLTLSVTANYPLLRRFVDEMAKNLPHSILDSISCSRDDITVAALSCDLAFSAIFQKSGRG